MEAKAQYTLLRKYIVKEFLASFAVAFTFFFFIFFVNQILLLIQRVMVKNVSVADMLTLVVLSIPQFLIYTFPFSSLSAASMVIGEFSAHNEIIAMRSSGIPYRRIFSPVLVIGIVLSLLTFIVADMLLPFSSVRYQKEYREIMQKIPTLDVASYSSVTVGDKIITAGRVEDNIIHDIILFDAKETAEPRTISARQGTIFPGISQNLTYRLELENPVVLEVSSTDPSSWSLSSARTARLSVDFIDQSGALATLTPAQMSSRDLISAIEVRKQKINEQKQENLRLQNSLADELASVKAKAEDTDNGTEKERLKTNARQLEQKITSLKNYKIEDFYYTYYRAELHKKLALSAACFCLILTALPISFIKVRHGRLIGFGLSLLIACVYWFILFFMQLKIFDVSFSPGWLMWFPDVLVLAIGLAFLSRQVRT
ncbi:LptF/LptG family permease [Parasphaerochaeta coccoides]|uniref:Permease YjgP/YjgQ family protein n=1 Tax=Parasphaerochaeta coccoides (strain ATCC BAA-1237 / DSM 17374 / SPN1) TaxID=760011 RepID=F4GK57_PARC1|nr:LptF/LptG family permease [Parasphaerochaeta coccoides]AEC01829.1 permease YjgP/YjgQ family protein [Parasphaerochaeta coccoides DSM 17374]